MGREMDKSWMQHGDGDRFGKKYSDGVKQFMSMACRHTDRTNRIRCPCRKCNNVYIITPEEVEDHLFEHGIVTSYTKWVHHGEPYDPIIEDDDDDDFLVDNEEEYGDDIQELLEDVHAGTYVENFVGESSTSQGPHVQQEEGSRNGFGGLLRDAQHELYPGCQKYSKLSFLMKALHLKVINRWSNKSFNMMLEFFKDVLPVGETVPRSYYEAKNIMRDLGLGYIPIHACKNDCVLFWKEYENINECPECGEPRYKYQEGKSKKIPQKVLRYFPLKPRLQRLFMSRKIAEDMTWHKDKRVEENNVLRHPADSKAWQEFDNDHDWFAKDPRNVRLGLASDGFNPFGNMSNSYSMWPVMLMPYNLPPWKCMKDPFLFMSLLIPGPKAPGNDIDVYLRPLIDELKELWDDGVDTYDASKKQNFRLHAALLWTINDFPAYGNLSGWSTKGFMTCPTCNKEKSSLSLKNGRKICYIGHRRFLPTDHPWRNSYKFDGKREKRLQPKNLSGDDVLEQLKQLKGDTFGKAPNKKKRTRDEMELNWTKQSIFFTLPYWQKLKLRHNLDVMHIEKNICDNVLNTLMNVDGKTKDNVKALLDLELMGIRKELHLRPVGDKFIMPSACYTLLADEKKNFCEWLKLVKLPDGYASHIAQCVNVKESKISGLKSHDCHVLLQRLLPVALRGYLRKDVCTTLIQLSFFFKELCSKTLKLEVLERLEKDIVMILCKLETIFPPAFFDVMVHLAIHLPKEAILGGPVQYRWMYPIERFLCTLKKYVRNKARPEGSIVEAYIDNECLTFCSMYLRGVETKFNREERNYDGGQGKKFGGLSVFAQNVRPLGAAKNVELDLVDHIKARWYVLNNCEEVGPYLSEHMEEITRQNATNVQQRHEAEFPLWFEKRMKRLRENNSPEATDNLWSLACGPDRRVTQYTGCIINGIRFHTKEREQHRITQNSGVVVKGEHQSKETDFYGVLTNVIELTYCGGNRVFLFKCDWWDVANRRSGIHIDDYFTSVNVSRKWYNEDPFVLASQAEQVFYVNDTKLGDTWKVVQRIQPRSLFDVPEAQGEDKDEEMHIDNDEAYQQSESLGIGITVPDDRDIGPLHRDDVAPAHVDASIIEKNMSMAISLEDDAFIDNDCSDEEDDTMVEYYEDQEDVLVTDDDTDIES